MKKAKMFEPPAGAYKGGRSSGTYPAPAAKRPTPPHEVKDADAHFSRLQNARLASQGPHSMRTLHKARGKRPDGY